MSKAPALDFGLNVLAELGKGSGTLEDLARRTGVPKASLLRILETLQGHRYVDREEGRKVWRSRVMILSRENRRDVELGCARKILKALCDETGQVGEWFIPDGGGLLMVAREEPPEAPLTLRARVGSKRLYGDELDAPGRVAFRSGLASLKAGMKLERAVGTERKSLTLEGAKRAVDEVKEDLASDDAWNAFGVRRHAAAVRRADRSVAGVLTVAEIYSPRHEEGRARLVEALARARRDLEKSLAEPIGE